MGRRRQDGQGSGSADTCDSFRRTAPLPELMEVAMRALQMSITLAAISFVIAGCTSSTPEKEKIYDIKGKVVSVDADKKTVRLDHEDIPGFMKAMEMNFTVQD